MYDEYIITPVKGNKKSPFCIELAGITYANADYKISRNSVNFFTVEYVISGKGHICVDGKEYTAVGGDSYILPSNSSLHYYSDSKEPWEKIWFNAIGDFSNKLTKMFGIDNKVVFAGVDTSVYLKEILRLCENRELGAEELNRKCAGLCTELIMCIADSEKKDNNLSEEAMLLKEYIDLHIEDKVSIKKLASLVYRSESQTIRIFKKNFNKTPYDYILDEKIEKARSLIINTNLSIKEISYRMGFADEHYFSSIFKKKTGESPTSCRKAI